MITNSFLFPFFSMLSLGGAWFLVARSSKDVGALRSMFLFQLIGLPFFLLFLPFASAGATFIDIRPIFLVGIYETFVMLLLLHAFEVGNVSIVAPVTDSYALFTLIFGIFFLHESLTLPKLVGAVLVFLGIVLLSTKKSKQKINKIMTFNKGVIPAVIAALGTAGFFILTGVLARSAGWFATALGIRVAITATAFILLILFKKDELKNLFTEVPYKWIVPAALFDVIGFALYNIAVTHNEVSYVTIIISAQTPVTVMLSYVFLKERLKFHQSIGLICVFIGLIAINIK